MKYTVEISFKVRKYLKKLNPLLRVRLIRYIDSLEDFSNLNLDIKKLKWEKKEIYRLRVGKYRIIFEKQDDKLIILVMDIGSRGDIYK